MSRQHLIEELVSRVLPVEKKLDYTFRNKKLLVYALTHTSYINILKKYKLPVITYERLEFLGDAVLEFVVTDYLYRKFKKQDEGTLTALRAYIVKTKTLAKVANDLALGRFLIIGASGKGLDVHKSEYVLADVFEAVVGAIYLDSGIRQAQRFIRQKLLATLDLKQVLQKKLYKDVKTQFQEIIQEQLRQTPHYETRPIEKQPQKYRSYVKINNVTVAQGEGATKADAQTAAAKQAMQKIDKIIKKLDHAKD